VAHVCNPSYSGGRDQGDPGSKPPLANSSARPYPTKLFTKKKKIGLVEWLKVKALSSSTDTIKKSDERMNKRQKEKFRMNGPSSLRI
jgi:hypothetical protein